MDPSAPLCLLYDSLKESHPTLPIITEENRVTLELSPSEAIRTVIGRGGDTYNSWYSGRDDQLKIVPDYRQAPIDSDPPPTYSDPKRYKILQTVKDSFDTEGFIEARNNANPFELIGRSIFINRAAVKLANIDAVHHVTNDIFTFDLKQSTTPFTFCDIAAGPGGFTQYLQYRYPLSVGYGITLKHETLDWSRRFLDMAQFTPFYGEDGTGNLYTNWNQFTEYVHSQQPDGVDLVTADGGFDLEDSMDKTLLHRQEFLSSRLFLTQALVGIACAKAGGNFVLKTFDTVTDLSAQIIFSLAQCFDRITIFKPVSSRPANAEKYVICINRTPDITHIFNLLSDASRLYTDDLYLTNLFLDPLPKPFQQWLTQINSESTNRQLRAAQDILLFLRGTPPDIPLYDTDKFLVIWNLPDTPPRLKRRRDNNPPAPNETIIQIR